MDSKCIKRKIMSLFLIVAMIFSMIPSMTTAVSAEDGTVSSDVVQLWIKWGDEDYKITADQWKKITGSYEKTYYASANHRSSVVSQGEYKGVALEDIFKYLELDTSNVSGSDTVTIRSYTGASMTKLTADALFRTARYAYAAKTDDEGNYVRDDKNEVIFVEDGAKESPVFIKTNDEGENGGRLIVSMAAPGEFSKQYWWSDLFGSATNQLTAATIEIPASAIKTPAAEPEDSYESGQGTAEDPYIIANAEQLKLLADKVNGGENYADKYFKLSADIDLSTLKDEEGNTVSWTPIGGGDAVQKADDNGYDKFTPALKFMGDFNGDGHTIKGMNVTKEADFIGLFGHNGGTLSNFTVEGKVSVTGAHDYVAGVAAFNSGTITRVISKVEIDAQKCYNIGGVAGTNTSGNWKYKGDDAVTAKNAAGIIRECGNEGKITGQRTMGGIVGSNFGTVNACYNYGDIDIKWNGSMAKIGGIAGVCSDTGDATWAPGHIINCYNTGDISWSGAAPARGYGGIVCFIGATSTVTNCYSIGMLKEGYADHTPICPRCDSTTGIANNYFIDTIKIKYMEDLENEYKSGKQKSEAELKSDKFLTEIGGAYTSDTKNLNNGYPVLKWQNGIQTVAEKIEIDTSEMITEYVPGQKVRTEGMKAYVVYNDGSKEYIPYNCYSAEKTDELTKEDDGTKVKVLCTANGMTGEAEVTITINQKQLEKISVPVNPAKYTYRAGESFDSKGMKVKAYYSNDSLLSSEKYGYIEDYKVDAPEKLSADDNKITVSYKLNGVTKKETFTVVVKDQSNPPEQDEKGVYQIKTAEDLVWFANEVTYFGNNKISAKLIEDIDMSSNKDFVTIGCRSMQQTQTTGVNAQTMTYSWTNSFKGTFDGNGKTVTMALDGKQYTGFIGNAEKATIKDLTTAGSVNAAGSYAAGIVAYGDGTIDNCINKADITNTNYYTGGIAGSFTGTVSDSENKGSISGASYAAGIVGYGAASIDNCVNEGTVQVSGNYAAGINGMNAKKIDKCINNGTITAGNNTAGGIAGQASSSGTVITNSANTADIQAKTIAAGIVARGNASTIENCYNNGTVTAAAGTEKAGAAGIIAEKLAYNKITIANCYNTGNIVLGKDSAANAAKGEIIGFANVNGSNIATITNSYYPAGEGKAAIGGTTAGAANEDSSAAKTTAEFSALAKDLGEAYKDSCCGPVFKDQTAVEHKEVKADSKAPTCTEDGLKEGTYCEVCGAVVTAQETIKAAGHTWSKEYTVDKAATTEADGSRSYHCTVCDAVKDGSETAISKISSTSLSSSAYTYNGKVKAPSVTVKDSEGNKLVKDTDYIVKYASGRKNVGTYKVSITFKGSYSGTASKTFKINPMSTKITSKTGSKKAFTVKWKKVSTQITGYQVRYSTSSKMTSAKTSTISSYKTTSKKISNLKSNKKYYVQIRTYKTVDGTKYYSNWSSSTSVKTK